MDTVRYTGTRKYCGFADRDKFTFRLDQIDIEKENFVRDSNSFVISRLRCREGHRDVVTSVIYRRVLLLHI